MMMFITAVLYSLETKARRGDGEYGQAYTACLTDGDVAVQKTRPLHCDKLNADNKRRCERSRTRVHESASKTGRDFTATALMESHGPITRLSAAPAETEWMKRAVARFKADCTLFRTSSTRKVGGWSDRDVLMARASPRARTAAFSTRDSETDTASQTATRPTKQYSRRQTYPYCPYADTYNAIWRAPCKPVCV